MQLPELVFQLPGVHQLPSVPCIAGLRTLLHFIASKLRLCSAAQGIGCLRKLSGTGFEIFLQLKQHKDLYLNCALVLYLECSFKPG